MIAIQLFKHFINPKKHCIEPFWGVPKNFYKSEIPLFFRRQYYGYPKGKENYYELNQLVTHLLGLHWSNKIPNSYCLLNNLGEEIEKIRIIEHDEVNLILIRKKILEKLLHLGKWNLVRYFEITRFNCDNPSFTSYTSTVHEAEKFDIKYEVIIYNNNECVIFRGAQIKGPELPEKEVLSWKYGTDEENANNKYCEFIVYDLKNK